MIYKANIFHMENNMKEKVYTGLSVGNLKQTFYNHRHFFPALLLETKQLYHIYPTPPLGQEMTQGQFLSGV